MSHREHARARLFVPRSLETTTGRKSVSLLVFTASHPQQVTHTSFGAPNYLRQFSENRGDLTDYLGVDSVAKRHCGA